MKDGERKPLAALILAKAKGDDAGDDGDDGEKKEDADLQMGMQNAAADLIAGVKAGDTKAVAEALTAACQMHADSY